MRTPIAVTSLVFAVSSFALPALAQETVGAHVTPGSPTSMFGARGEIAISSEAGATYTHTSISGLSGATTSLVLRPGVDYFLMDRLSIGAFVGIDRKTTPADSTTTWGIGPRVGYDVAFSDHFSIWPRIGFSYNSVNVKTDAWSIGGIPNALFLELESRDCVEHFRSLHLSYEPLFCGSRAGARHRLVR